MIKKSILFITLFAVGLFSYGQNSGKAKALLDEVYNKVQSYDNIYIDFQSTLENTEANLKQETNGNVTLDGEKYLLNYFGAKQMYDGKKVYTVVPENEEVTIEDVNEDNDNVSPSKMLTFYKTGHNYEWDILQNVGGRKIQYVKLIPIDSNTEIKSVLLGIDTQTKHIYKLIQTGSNGTKTTITVNSFKTNQPISSTLFTFDEKKYEDKGYYIIRNQALKILDQYILRRFLYNFFSSFFILIVIFIFQGIWLFIDDLAGKGLGMVIIGKFIFYFIPTLVDKVLPLTVLLSSILTFGTFAENYEFAAMKASGISLQRGMRSLIVFVLFLGLVTFFFANDVIPKSEQKMFNLRRNIAKVKPAAAITEGVFSDFEGTGQGMNIKVDKKYGEQDRFLDNVIIHKKTDQNINNTVIKAKAGELISSEESDIIQLVLKDGNYYEEIVKKDAQEKRKQPFAKSNFDTYTINIDISELNDQDLEEDQNITTNKMKNVGRLIKDIDSLRENNLEKVTAFSKNVVNRMGAFPVKAPIDTTTQKLELLKAKDTIQRDSIKSIDQFVSGLEQWEQIQVMKKALNEVSSIINTVDSKKDELQSRYKFYNSHILSLHQKYALALSCIILFFVGAPLGAIIRKGGLGLPMVVAIILFLTYYFIGVFAGNYAKEGNIHPAIGAWLPTMIMLPLGISLTRRATADKGLVGFGHFIDRIKSLFKKKEKEAEDQ